MKINLGEKESACGTAVEGVAEDQPRGWREEQESLLARSRRVMYPIGK